MPTSLDQAKSLEYGQVIYHCRHRNADGSPQRWRVNGKPKTWKTRPGSVRVPLKHELRWYGYLNELNLMEFALTEEEAISPKIF